MLPLVMFGAIIGALIATFVSSFILKTIFITLVFLVFLKTLMSEFFIKEKQTGNKPKTAMLHAVSFITGVVASMLGIGGSVIIVPFFRSFNYPMQKASALANGLAVPSGLIGSFILAVSGYNHPGLPPYSTGYIYWPAFLCLFLGGLLGSKLGIYFSKFVPDRLYGKCYAFLLLIVILSMLI